MDETLAAHLIGAQFPALAGLPVRRLASPGTVNALFRVGERLVARFPFAAASEAELHAEAEALAEFARASPFPASEPVGVGAPTEQHPSAWSVQTWVPGEPATPDGQSDSDAAADDLVTLIGALRKVDMRGRTFDGRGRGGDLRDHEEWMALCFRRSAHLLDADRAARLWARLRELPRAEADAMCHRDLIPPNLLVVAGRLAGVLDAGAFGPADPALDLVGAWHLCDGVRRERVRHGLRVDDAEWLRGAAWALQQAMGLGWYYERSNPAMSALGVSTMRRLLSDPELAAG